MDCSRTARRTQFICLCLFWSFCTFCLHMQLRFSVVLITPKTHTDVYYDYSLMDFRKVEASQKRILCFSLFLFILTIRNYSNRQKEKKWKNSKEKGNKENMCSGRGLLCAFVAFRYYLYATYTFIHGYVMCEVDKNNKNSRMLLYEQNKKIVWNWWKPYWKLFSKDCTYFIYFSLFS